VNAPRALLLLTLAAPLGCARADVRALPSADAGADAPSAPADASLDGPIDAAAEVAPAPAKDLGVLDVPRSRSPRPTAKEWEGADEDPVGASGCVLALVREWARLRCGKLDDAAENNATPFASVVLLAGKRGDESATIETLDRERISPQTRATLVMPLRPGDRRVVELNEIEPGGFGYDPTPSRQVPGLTLSETWLDGAPGPTLAIDDGLRE
jgi:hypothetical protein